MNALVLSGGSIKGAFQVGAIAEMLERGFVPDRIYGTSVGSLNGGFLAERAGRAKIQGTVPSWPEIGRELEALWRNRITHFRVIGRKRNALELGGAVLFHCFNGFLDNSRLKKLVYQELRPEALHQSPVCFSPCVVNVRTGKAAYVSHTHPQILDYIIASTAIPLIMPVSWVEQEPFVDGGIREVAPLYKAIQDGANEILCIACDPKETEPISVDVKNPTSLMNRLMDIVVNELLNNDIEHALAINAQLLKFRKNVPAFLKGKCYVSIKVIRPQKPLEVELESFSAKDIALLLALGRESAKSLMG